MSKVFAASLAAIACAGCHDSALTPDAGAGDAPADAGPDAPPDVALSAGMVVLSGDIAPVHDPVIIATPTGYQLYATGDGLRVHESPDLVNWRFTGPVFTEKPAWITTTDASSPNSLWAPDVSYFGGQYHLYYSASSFGKNASCIGHATSASLDPPDWTDRGAVICSTAADNWNAIDPAAFVDADGAAWLAFGSFWSGIKLIALDADGARQGTSFYALSTRSNTAVEAPYLVHHGDYYYLFESVDFCCRGVNSTYKIVVGRSSSVTGPYVDRAGTPLLSGGGTVLVAGGDRWKGPGHSAVLHTAGGDYNVFHAYDAQASGSPTLRIAELSWTDDQWPTSAGP